MIYLITSQKEKYMKFGFTENYEKRFSHYKTHNPDFVIIGLIEGNKEVEKRIHDESKHLLINKSEWMIFNEELYYSFINNKTFKKYPYIENEEFIYVLPFTSLVNTISECKILFWLFKYSEYYDKKYSYIGNIVILNKRIKNEISNNTELAISTINNTITSLSKKNLIIKDKSYCNTYYLNSNYFFKGDLKDRTKCVKLIQEYKIV